MADAVDYCSGPGKLTQALGIELAHNNLDLSKGPIKILPQSPERAPDQISSQRIGITKATELHWRFCAKGSTHVSRPWPKGLMT